MNILMVTSTADSGAGSLRQAIADAQDGDVILFDADVFPAGQTTAILLSSQFQINKSVSIYGGFSDGNGGYTSGATVTRYVIREVNGVEIEVVVDDEHPALENEVVLMRVATRVALDWQSIRRGFYVNTADIVLNFSGVGFYNGLSDSSGGAAIFNNNSQVTLNNCVFDNFGGSYGGGICFNNTSIGTLNNCVLSNCSSIHRGGAIYATVSSQCTLNNCSIIGCSAAEYGGAIQGNNSSTVILNNCIVTNCSSNTGGAFAFSNSATCELNDCTITDCDSIKYNGGGVYITDSVHTNLNNCLFANCSSIGSGAAFYAIGTSQNTLNNCRITNSTSDSSGGVCFGASSVNVLSGCTISNCSATTNGGGVYAAGTSQNTLNDCTITGCSASNNGGGVYAAGTSQNTLNACTITSCSATSGGGIYSTNTSANTLNNNVVENAVYIGVTSILNASSTAFNAATIGSSAFLNINGGVTSFATLTLSSGATITIEDGAALTITTSATIGAATFTSDGRGYLAVAPGINVSAATLDGVVACSYGAGMESFTIDEDGASWTAQDLTTPILIETRDAGGEWQTLTDSATGGEYATTFALESTARAFDGVAFFVATLQGYWQADAGAVDSNDWSVRGFAAADSNGGGDVDAAQGWTVTPSTVTPNADGV